MVESGAEEAVLTRRRKPVARIAPVGRVDVPDRHNRLAGCAELWTNDQRRAAASGAFAVDVIAAG
ncbi:hypothetical protein AB1K54_15755 [Microbacterium sp. BWT-B31]|uniref:hypothetical protein n=1 Tax=Microbacterium sp. BWT-B31 TaxID=3232072 RepID=UPI003529CBAE